VFPLKQSLALVPRDESRAYHLREDYLLRSALLSAPLLCSQFHQRIDWVAMPSLTLPGTGKLRYLLIPDSNMAKSSVSFLLKAVQSPVIVGKIVLVRKIEKGKLLF
jgi:hypothetical protein